MVHYPPAFLPFFGDFICIFGVSSTPFCNFALIMFICNCIAYNLNCKKYDVV